MKITKINIKNFRLLKDVTVDLEENLTLILGKNNCGKTSFLLILDKFLGNKSFSFDDFNADFKEELKAKIDSDAIKDDNTFHFLGISLKLFIEYDEHDDLSNIGNKVIMDLDPDNKVVVLGFEYYLSEDRFKALKNDYKSWSQKRESKQKKSKDAFSFIKDNHAKYFQIAKKSIQYNTTLQKEYDNIFIDLVKEKILIDKIISFKWISAKRSVSNKDTEKTLSLQSAKIYKKLEAKNSNPDVIEKFRDALNNTDEDLNIIYNEIFQEVIDDVKMFGGIKQDESAIKIISSLQHKELLEENTTVVYSSENQGHELPENYNGLGYMNLISMIFEIKILLHEFQKEEDENPSDINLLFIEEPEVHTHPQMQRIFIKNIKSLLRNGIAQKYKLQTVISTHSSHIVSESDFEDIKYFKKENSAIISKNLKDLKNEYNQDENAYYKFLKQYLTLHRSELFFADKAIFIEGDTERVLLPAMMKKLDQEDAIHELQKGLASSLPLLSQNISIIEVGAYSQIFEKFIDFIGIKSLVITDIDSIKSASPKDKDNKTMEGANEIDKTNDKCLVSEGTKTSNSSLKFFYGEEDLNYFKSISLDKKVLKKNSTSKKWEQNSTGNLLCVFQTKENDNRNIPYHARSFEDAFLHINRKFMTEHIFDERKNFIGNLNFPSLTQNKMKQFAEYVIDAFKMAEGVNSKPSYAMEILLNSIQEEIEIQNKNTSEKIPMIIEFSNWNTPAYIKEGLQWLKQD